MQHNTTEMMLPPSMLICCSNWIFLMCLELLKWSPACASELKVRPQISQGMARMTLCFFFGGSMTLNSSLSCGQLAPGGETPVPDGITCKLWVWIQLSLNLFVLIISASTIPKLAKIQIVNKFHIEAEK